MNKQELFKVGLEELIDILEERGLGWSIQHLNKELQARVYDTNDQCISRYVAPNIFEGLAYILAEAMYQVNWTLYPEKKKGQYKTAKDLIKDFENMKIVL